MKKALITVLIVITILSLLVAAIGTYFLLDKDLFNEKYSFQVLEAGDGTPIEGAEIRITEVTYDHYSPFFQNDMDPVTRNYYRMVRSNENGWVHLNVPRMNKDRGYYEFRISKKGYMDTHTPSYLYNGQAMDILSTRDDMVKIRFFSIAYLSGTITDDNGTLMEGITITSRSQRGHIDDFCITDENGKYEFKDLRSGLLDLSISGPDIQTIGTYSVILDKFQMNIVNITVERSNMAFNEVTLEPTFRTDEHLPIEPGDGELMILFIRENEEEVDICHGSALFKDGIFSVRIPDGRYQVHSYYFGAADIQRMDHALIDDHRSDGGLLEVSGNITASIRISLRAYVDPFC